MNILSLEEHEHRLMLHSLGFTDQEIAKDRFIHSNEIGRWRRNHGLKSNTGCSGIGGYRPGSGRKKVAR